MSAGATGHLNTNTHTHVHLEARLKPLTQTATISHSVGQSSVPDSLDEPFQQDQHLIAFHDALLWPMKETKLKEMVIIFTVHLQSACAINSSSVSQQSFLLSNTRSAGGTSWRLTAEEWLHVGR